MKKVLVLVLALALLCSSALAAEIGFLPPAMTSPFYASCIEGATPVAEANGYDLLVMSPPTEDDYATQMSMMEDMITRGVAGIAVCGINLDALIPGIQKANEAGIPVVMFNTITELEGAEVYAYSGYNQYGGGAKIADWSTSRPAAKPRSPSSRACPLTSPPSAWAALWIAPPRPIRASKWSPPSRATGSVRPA